LRAEAVATTHGDVSVVLDGSDGAGTLVVLAHGAGGDMNSEPMSAISAGLAGEDVAVCRFNFAYSERGKRSPDRADVLEEVFRAVAERIRSSHGAGRIVLGGKSMGGRIASQIVAGGWPADALLFLGYPLHPPGRPERMRDAHLPGIEVPMLFIEGTRDPFCPLETLQAVLAGLGDRATLAVIEDGDHSFKVRKSSGRSTTQAWQEVVRFADQWIRGLAA